MEIPFPRTVQQSCPTTRSRPHGRSCQCYSRPLNRFYHTPTADERSAAIRKLKTNRAPGICGITAELLKSGGAPIISWLLPIFTLIWKYCVIPIDWNIAIILPLWKGKGPKSDYTKYRGISLLSVPAKVFAHICLARIKRTIFAKQRPQQSGFIPGRSTLDRIIGLRLLAERRHEFRQPLYAAYIDLRAAFDSLDRNSLWNILKTIGIPPKLVDITKTLYSSTRSVVRVNGTISEAFSISSGVRQGCVLAANLFNTATDRILNNTTQALTLGVNYDDSGQLLDNADDVVIFADLFDTVKEALFIFNEQSKQTVATCQLVQDQASILQPMDTHSTINTHRNTTCHNYRQLYIPWQHHRQ